MNADEGKFSGPGETRRSFIKKTAVTVAAGSSFLRDSAYSQGAAPELTVVVDPRDSVLQQPPVRWAVEQLRDALKARGVASQLRERAGQNGSAVERIVLASRSSSLARQVLDSAGICVPDASESLALVRRKGGNRQELLVCGADARGLVYGLLELADRVTHGADPIAALRRVDRIFQRPANPIRSVARLFSSEPEDKPWFYDKTFWQAYLTMLVRERFNRFSLTLGLGYNAPRRVHDSYFYFAYPYLISVPGYRVRVRGLPDEERDRNFAMLRWISEEATARGLHFQLALWTHAYQFIDSPDVNYTIEGLTPETHAAYCRDALHRLLESCPAIRGLTFRAHSESGIPEGSYDFWRTVFDGAKRCGRRVEIDIHSKGIDHKLIDIAVATGLPVQVSPKYWAEHMGLPYHQAAIRELERARPAAGSAAPLEQQRRFTRYGYGDYLSEDRLYGVYYRIWPGTQRLLLWGDPVMAAGYGRHATFCGSLGLELCEPLSFKGRMGSGSGGGRDPYADASLRPAAGNWEKYLYSYRLWGRLLYDPNEDPESWGRLLRTEYGTAAKQCEAALASASRILPLVTTAHDPSASNNRYWPEVYTDMPIVNPERPHPYGDTPSPRRFATVSPLDPALFSSIDEYRDELVKKRRTGKYSPLDVARWLEGFAKSAESNLEGSRAQLAKADSPSFRRLAVDVKAQSGLGRFFAGKLRAGVGYAIYESTGDRGALEKALHDYRAARDAWKKLVSDTKGVYKGDLTFGHEPYLRGHWSDRLAAIEADLADMEKARERKLVTSSGANDGERPTAMAALVADPPPPRPRCKHVPPASFRRGEPISIEMSAEPGSGLALVRLHYRHVNQAEDYRVSEMSFQGERYRQIIPGEYTDSPYPLLYYFELRDSKGNAWLYPGLDADLSNQPYFVVRSAKKQGTRS